MHSKDEDMNVKFSATLIIATVVLVLFLVPSRAASDDKNTKRDESGKALSRSKASVWVDTNRGSIFSSSLGSSQLEKSGKPNGEPVGRSSNMLLTLLLQPMQQQQPLAVTPVNYQSESQFKPIMLLLQQQQDISERVLEKQEKLEKMNVHLQQQVKHQQQLIVDLLEQIKLFLEAIGESSSSGGKSSAAVSRQPSPMSSDDPNYQQTSSSSVANAVVTVPRQKKNADQEYALPNNMPLGYPMVAPEYSIRSPKRIPPIVVSSQSETVEYLKLNNTSDANQKQPDVNANYPAYYYPGNNNNNNNNLNGIGVAQQPSLYKTLEVPLNMGDINKQMAAN